MEDQCRFWTVDGCDIQLDKSEHATKEECSTCRFYMYGQCRRRAPVTVSHLRVGFGEEFPCSAAHGWCGEYDPTPKGTP